ncbi:hypothetical protein BC826DRAFT_906832, partial [Russula brevipes]
QINLIVGDYFKLKRPFMKIVDEALEVVKWFNNHSYALGLLRDGMRTKFGYILALILPVLTRWTSHFLCVSRLLRVEFCLRAMLLDSQVVAGLRVAAGDRADAKRKAEEILKIIGRQDFWDDLKLYVF